MTSIDAKGARAVLLSLVALAVGPLTARAAEKDVELSIDLPGDHYWKVTGVEGGRFVARRFQKGDSRGYYKIFHENAGRMVFDGECMAWDAEGKSKDVLARKLPAGPAGSWDVDGRRHLGQARLRVPAGPLKGWYVGLGPLKEDGAARGYAHLVLVKEAKDAALFGWPRPDACGGR